MTIQAANIFWENPPSCFAPLFPIIFFEILGANECRGFLELVNLTGDVDFVRYPLVAEEFIIDSEGNLFSLMYDKIVYPMKFVKKLSKNNLIDLVTPSVIYCDELKLLYEIKNESSIKLIVEKLANRFTW